MNYFLYLFLFTTFILSNNSLFSTGFQNTTDLPISASGLIGITVDGCGFYSIGGGIYNLYYDPNTLNWIYKNPPPEYLYDITCAVSIRDKIYIAGGKNELGYSKSTLYVYDTSNDQWERKADLPVPLSEHSCAAFEDNIYIFGSIMNDHLYKYNALNNTWYNLGYTNKNFTGSSAAFSPEDNKIYISSYSLIIFDPVLETFDDNYIPLPQSHFNGKLIYNNKKLYLIGGVNDYGQFVENIHIYDIETSNFTEGPSIIEKRKYFGASFANSDIGLPEGGIYIFGGESANGILCSMEELIYNFEAPCYASSSDGIISMEKEIYKCDDILKVQIRDYDLIGMGNYQINVKSNTEPTPEILNLIENPQNSGIFKGQIPLIEGISSNSDGYLGVLNNDTITAIYLDEDDGNGNQNIFKYDYSTLDCEGPQISNLLIDNIKRRSVEISWEANEISNGKIIYGFSCSSLDFEKAFLEFNTSHLVNLDNLNPSTNYYYKIISADPFGNTSIEDNNGECFSFTTSSVGWDKTTSLPIYPYAEIGVTPDGCGIFAIGGEKEYYTKTYNYFYSITNKVWVEKEPVPEFLSSCGNILDNKIYISGGDNYSTVLDKLYSYDILNNTWSQKSNLPVPLTGHSCASYGENIYVFGGSPDLETLNYDIYLYNSSTDIWTNIGFNNYADYGQSAVYSPFDGKIYISGGSSNPARFISYDPLTNNWDTTLPQLPNGHYFHNSIYADGKIFILGGKINYQEYIKNVDIYDISSKVFLSGPEMADGRSNFGAVFATSDINNTEGSIYIFGGYTESGVYDSMEELFYNLPAPCILNGYDGKVQFSKDFYSCNSEIAIYLEDNDLAGNGSYQLIISSSTEPSGENVVLLENPQDSGKFYGSILAEEGNPETGDGTLSILNNDEVKVTYIDQNDGNGNMNVSKNDTAQADCLSPNIFNIQILSISINSAKIIWETDEISKGKVIYGLSCGNLDKEVISSDYVLNHSLLLNGLESSTTYYLKVISTDPAGNEKVDDNGGNCYSFTTLLEGWEETTPLPYELFGNSGVSLDGCGFYSIGPNLNYYYDPQTMLWTPRVILPYSSYEYCSAAINEKIYIIGGNDGYYPSNKIQIYNTITDSWETRSDFPFYLSSHSCAAFGNDIYIFGGKFPDNRLSYGIYKYNIITNTVEDLGYNPYADIGSSSVFSPYDNKIYTSGGYLKTKTFIAYDPVERRFDTTIPQLANSFSYHNSVYANEKIFIFGGNPNTGKLDIYDLNSKTFTPGPSMQIPRTNFGAVFANSNLSPGKGAIYAFGGRLNQYDITNSMEELIYDLPAPCFANTSDGIINLDKEKYGCSDKINIKLEDMDLAGNGFYVISIQSDTETAPEILTLFETPSGSGIFKGLIQTKSGNPVNGDTFLSISDGDEIAAIYIDLNDGNGNQNVQKIDFSIADCLEPEIFNVNVINIYNNSAKINWNTNENSDSKVMYGDNCSNLTVEQYSADYILNHSIILRNLNASTTYYFKVSSKDEYGNLKIDDNNGQCYIFTTTDNGWNGTTSLPVEAAGIVGASQDGCGFYSIGPNLNYYYDPQSLTWYEKTPMPEPIEAYCSGIIGNKIYIPGGEGPNYTIKKTLYAYDIENDIWESKADLPVPLKAHSCASFNNDIYVFGGQISYESKNIYIYKYDSINNVWQNIGLNQYLDVGQSAVFSPIDNKIYISGGKFHQYTFVAYDPLTNSFDNTIPNLPRSRMYHRSVYTNGKIYLIGGSDALWYPRLEVDVYDIQSKTFTEGPYLNSYREGFGVVYAESNLNSQEGAIYIFGGWSLSGETSIMEEFVLGYPSPCGNNCLNELGDINSNNLISTFDASLALQYLVGFINFTEEEKCRADVNRNGNVTSIDISFIMQCSVGLCNSLPTDFLNSCQSHDNCQFN